MNWDAIGAVGEIVGAFAVVVTLIFLTLQMRQSNRSQRSTAYQSYLASRSRMQTSVQDPDINASFLNASFDPLQTSPEDLRNYHQTMHNCMTYFEGTFRLWQDGMLSDEDWNSNLIMLGEFRGTQGFKFWWPAVIPFFGSEFVNAVETAPVTKTGLERFLEAIEESNAIKVER